MQHGKTSGKKGAVASLLFNKNVRLKACQKLKLARAFYSGGSFRYAYDGIGNRVSAQDGSSANLQRYVSNSLNQYVSIFSPGVIPIRGRTDADAKVAVTTTVGGTSATYMPERSGQDYSIDIPVDNSQGAVTAAVQVDALRHDGTLDIDLHRRLSGDYSVPAATVRFSCTDRSDTPAPPPPLQCTLTVGHLPPDAQTANQRVFRFNDTVFAAYNSRDDDGQFALDLQDLATARTRRIPDPMRTLIDAFAHGHAIISGRRAAQNLDWLLKVAGNLPRK